MTFNEQSKIKNMENQIIKVEEISSIVSKAPQALQENKLSLEKAKEAGAKLIVLSKENGMSKDLDTLMSGYLEKIRATKKNMLEKRKPFTQMVDLLKKEFTSIESKVEDNEVVEDIVKIRNSYATQLYEKAESERKDSELKLNKQKEAVDILTDVETYYNDKFIQHLTVTKQQILDNLNNSTLETIDNVESLINNVSKEYSNAYFESIDYSKANPKYKYHEETEVKEILDIFQKDIVYNKQNDIYVKEIDVFKKETIDKINSKKTQLTEIKNIQDENIKKKMQEEENNRKIEETKKIEAQNKEIQQKQESEIDIKASAKQTQATISVQASLFESKPEVKKEYSIDIMDKAGYMELFKFWFHHEARELSNEKIENMTIARMKAYAEKKAVDEQIESANLLYNEVIKAK